MTLLYMYCFYYCHEETKYNFILEPRVVGEHPR